MERKILRNQLRDADRKVIDAGNLQNIKSDDVNRKVRSEALSSLDRDQDDVLDMIKMKRDNPHSLQLVADPFQMHLFSEKQLKIVLAETKTRKGKPIIHIDATGSLFRKPPSAGKACYYYAAVINIISTRDGKLQARCSNYRFHAYKF